MNGDDPMLKTISQILQSVQLLLTRFGSVLQTLDAIQKQQVKDSATLASIRNQQAQDGESLHELILLTNRIQEEITPGPAAQLRLTLGTPEPQ
jgi:hypothetical protein